MSRIDLIRPKVERAYKHIRDLEAAIIAFQKTEPYAFAAKKDPKTGKVQYYVAEAKDVPIEVTLISGDVLQNLRTALDYLAWQLVLTAGNTPDPGNTGFPISDSAKKYKTESLRKVKLMRPAAIDAIAAAKAYQGGNDTLWRLHRLNNIDKHRLILTVGMALSSFDAFAHFGRVDALPEGAKAVLGTRQFLWRPTAKRIPLKIGDVLFTSPSNEVDDQMDFTGEIAFNEIGICEGEPIVEMLHSTADFVSNLISDFAPLL